MSSQASSSARIRNTGSATLADPRTPHFIRLVLHLGLTPHLVRRQLFSVLVIMAVKGPRLQFRWGLFPRDLEAWKVDVSNRWGRSGLPGPQGSLVHSASL